jgi:dethiobiotin synthetase
MRKVSPDGRHGVISLRPVVWVLISEYVFSIIEKIIIVVPGGGLDEFALPVCDAPLVVELAGGVMVPLNDRATNLDLIRRLGLPVVLVSRHYLGSINHTLLTLFALRAHSIPVKGVVFNGEELPDTERIITSMGDVSVIGRVPSLGEVSQSSISDFASQSGWIV